MKLLELSFLHEGREIKNIEKGKYKELAITQVIVSQTYGAGAQLKISGVQTFSNLEGVDSKSAFYGGFILRRRKQN